MFNRESSTEAEGSIAYHALRYMQATLFPEGVVPLDVMNIRSIRESRIYGLRVRENLQLLAADALRYIPQGNRTDILPELWCHPNFHAALWCDPYDVLVPTDQRTWVKYEQLATYLGITANFATMPEAAAQQAAFAQKIAYVGNLY